MGPKYGIGERVVIKAGYHRGMSADARIKEYDTMVGEVLESVSAVAFLGDPQGFGLTSEERITVYHYTIKISDDLTLHDIFEEYLHVPAA
jgi:hypothetical protein